MSSTLDCACAVGAVHRPASCPAAGPRPPAGTAAAAPVLRGQRLGRRQALAVSGPIVGRHVDAQQQHLAPAFWLACTIFSRLPCTCAGSARAARRCRPARSPPPSAFPSPTGPAGGSARRPWFPAHAGIDDARRCFDCCLTRCCNRLTQPASAGILWAALRLSPSTSTVPAGSLPGQPGQQQSQQQHHHRAGSPAPSRLAHWSLLIDSLSPQHARRHRRRPGRQVRAGPGG